MYFNILKVKRHLFSIHLQYHLMNQKSKLRNIPNKLIQAVFIHPWSLYLDQVHEDEALLLSFQLILFFLLWAVSSI